MILAAALLVGAGAVLYWRYLDNSLAQKESADLSSAAQELANGFNYHMKGELQVLASVGESLEGLPRVENKNGLMLYLARQKVRGNFEMMGFQFPDGTAYFSDGSTQKNFLSEEEISSAYKNKYFISAPGTTPGRAAILLGAVPVYRSGGKAGVLFATDLIASCERILRTELPFEYTSWFIAGQDGKIVMQFLNGAYDNAVNILPGAGAPGVSCPSLMGEDIAANHAGSARCELPGGAYFVSYTPLDYNNWYLLAARPAAAQREAQKQLLAAVLLCAAIIIVLGFVMLFIMHAYRQHSLELYRAGFIDPLTGIGNGVYFRANFPSAAAAFRQKGTPFAVAVVNIRRFKAINDIYGYKEGDKILKSAAQAIKEELRDNELVCRLTGDRFFLLMSCADRAEFTPRIEKIMARIRAFCKQEELCFTLVVNAGVYLVDEDAPFFIMLDRANMALNLIRHSAGQTFAFYNDEYREQINHIAAVEGKMNAALESGQFEVFLQPKYSYKTGRIQSAEALVRWRDPQKGLIPPDKFIPVFEKNGFILKLDMYVLEFEVKLMAGRMKEGKRVVPAGVNFSRLHLEDPRFIDAVTEIVDRYAVPHDLVELEITESVAFDQKDVMRKVIDGFHARGFKLAMDDFGAGYSSLNILKDLAFDSVKLDKAFLDRGESDARMRQIITGTVEMLKKLGCTIVTEGVETKEQVEFLKAIGCDQAQGYLYSKPMPPGEFEKLLDEDAAKNL